MDVECPSPGRRGPGVPVRGNDIDTGQILPARFLKEVTFDRMGEFAFYDQRRDEGGEFDDHPFDEYENAGILVVDKNFDRGSSREHAPQALTPRRRSYAGASAASWASRLPKSSVTIASRRVSRWSQPNRSRSRRCGTGSGRESHAGIEIDVSNEEATYDDRVLDVSIPDSTKEALVEGIWDTTELLYSNMSHVHDTAGSLSYVDR